MSYAGQIWALKEVMFREVKHAMVACLRSRAAGATGNGKDRMGSMYLEQTPVYSNRVSYSNTTGSVSMRSLENWVIRETAVALRDQLKIRVFVCNTIYRTSR